MSPRISKDRLEELYRQYNRREFVHPDPLEFLYHYEDLCDREIVAFVASSLAYGRVDHILKSVSSVLERMEPTPSIFLKRTSLKTMRQTFSGFKHRFTCVANHCLLNSTKCRPYLSKGLPAQEVYLFPASSSRTMACPSLPRFLS